MIFITKCIKISLELYKFALQLAILHISFTCILILAIIKLVFLVKLRLSRSSRLRKYQTYITIGNPLLVDSPYIF